MDDFADKLRAFALAEVDLVGFASAGSFEGAPSGSKPADQMPGCRSVIVFALKHLDAFALANDFDCQAYSQDITNHMTLHQAYRISRFVEQAGFRAFPMVASVKMWPYSEDRAAVSGRISLRHAAQIAGLGRIGRIAIVVTPQFGPRVQLGVVLTDAELPPDAELAESPCTGCGACIDVCPAGALTDPGRSAPYVPTDREKCMAFRRAHGGESPLGFNNACSLCRSVCPVGRR